MDSSNAIQLLIAIFAGIVMMFSYNQCLDNSARELQHIADTEEKLLENQNRIIGRLDVQNGRIDKLESDSRLLDYRITKEEMRLENE